MGQKEPKTGKTPHLSQIAASATATATATGSATSTHIVSGGGGGGLHGSTFHHVQGWVGGFRGVLGLDMEMGNIRGILT